MKKSSLLLGFGAAASLLVTPMLSTGCRTTRHAHEEHSCGCKGEGSCGNKTEGKCGCKMSKDGKCGEDGKCSEGKCGGEGSCGEHKSDKDKKPK